MERCRFFVLGLPFFVLGWITRIIANLSERDCDLILFQPYHEHGNCFLRKDRWLLS